MSDRGDAIGLGEGDGESEGDGRADGVALAAAVGLDATVGLGELAGTALGAGEVWLNTQVNAELLARDFSRLIAVTTSSFEFPECFAGRNCGNRDEADRLRIVLLLDGRFDFSPGQVAGQIRHRHRRAHRSFRLGHILAFRVFDRAQVSQDLGLLLAVHRPAKEGERGKLPDE